MPDCKCQDDRNLRHQIAHFEVRSAAHGPRVVDGARGGRGQPAWPTLVVGTGSEIGAQPSRDPDPGPRRRAVEPPILAPERVRRPGRARARRRLQPDCQGTTAQRSAGCREEYTSQWARGLPGRAVLRDPGPSRPGGGPTRKAGDVGMPSRNGSRGPGAAPPTPPQQHGRQGGKPGRCHRRGARFRYDGGDGRRPHGRA